MASWRTQNPEYKKIFEDFLKGYAEFPEIFDIVKKNSRGRGKYGKIGGGRIWVIGGFVYRPIIQSVYPDFQIPEQQQIDIDFLIERGPGKKNLYIPEGWNPKITEAGYFYLDREKTRIDLNYLFNFHSITVRFPRLTRPKFKQFFAGTPLDIQSIAYDLTNRELGVLGKLGIESIRRRVVRINNLEEAEFEAQKRGISLEDLVTRKASELGFGYDLTPIQARSNSAAPRPDN